MVAATAWPGLAPAGPAPGATSGPPTSRAPESATPVTEAQATMALQQALEYAQFRYEVDGQERAGVPYRLGGQTTLEEFARMVLESPQRLAQAGIDASGLVVNAYRAVIPDLRFFTGPTGHEGTSLDASTESLYRWNARPLTLDEARPGDLVFFRSPARGGLSGVGLLSERRQDAVRVVVASASRGRVVEIGIRTQGEYWRTQVAGLGRLAYAAGPVPATAPQPPPS